MSTVWRAADTLLGRKVAVKRLSPHLTLDPQASARFRREAQAAARLGHPGIVTVFDVGEDEDGPWIAMELIEGETLAALLARTGSLPLAAVLSIAEQVAAALDHAHGRGVVHRDVKPSNIVIEDGGRTRLMDFGIGKAVDDPSTITTTGEIVGTLAYLAPEVLDGKPATFASDVYSLAVVVSEMISGRRTFTAGTTADLFAAIRAGVRIPLAGVPPVADAALDRALAADPAQRQETAGRLVDDMRGDSTLVLPGSVEAPPSTGPRPPAGPDDPTVVASPGGPVRRGDPPPSERPPRKLGLAGVLAGSGVLIVAVLAALLGSDGDPTPSPVLGSAPTTTTATTATTTAAPTTVPEGSPEAIASTFGELLDGLGPPRNKPKDVREARERVAAAVESWQSGDVEAAAASLEVAFGVLDELGDSSSRDALFSRLVDLADAMGFTVRTED